MIRQYLTETEFANLNGVYNSNIDYVIVDEENSPKKVVFSSNNVDGDMRLYEISAPNGGELDITENGQYDVTSYTSAFVDIPQPSGTYTITENGEYQITNYDTVIVNVGG